MKLAAKPYQGFNNYYSQVANIFENNRNKLIAHDNYAFDWRMLNPDGGYFMMTDITQEIPKIPRKYFFNQNNLGPKGEEPINQTIDNLEKIDVSPDMAFTKYFLE